MFWMLLVCVRVCFHGYCLETLIKGSSSVVRKTRLPASAEPSGVRRKWPELHHRVHICIFLHVQPWWTNMATDHTRDPTEAPTLFSEVPSVSFALLLLLHTGNTQSSAVCISCSTVLFLFLIVLLPLTLGRRQFLVSERMIRSVDLKSPWIYKPVFPFTPTTDSP